MKKIIKQKKYNITNPDLILDNNDRKYVLKIKDMPLENRPREKLAKHGPQSLSLQELVSILINAGTKNESVTEISNRIIREYGEKSIFAEKDVNKMSQEFNISLTKACQIIACGEIGRRLYEKKESGFVIIRTASDVYEYLKEMRGLSKEHLRALYLNSHNQIIHDEVTSIGTINSNLVHPREVFRTAIEHNAVAFVLAHNHPSGIVTPSLQDIEITKQLIKAGKIIGISLLDHVVISKNGYMSISADY